MGELLEKDEVYQIVGAAFEVFNELGAGFLEAVYQEAMELELRSRSIPFVPQAKLRIRYKGEFLQKEYYADLICFGTVLVEIKCIERLTPKEESQLLNYLKATGIRVGVLLNFAGPKTLEWKRLVL